MDMILGLSVNFKIFSVILSYVVGAHWNCLRGNSNVYLQHMSLE